MSIKKPTYQSLTLLTALVFCVGLLSFGQVSAAFNKNLLITDSLFDNASTMSANQIDSFLNTFPSSCISTHAKFTAVDPTGYNPTNGFLYGGQVSAGRVIYDSAQAYGINPQVLIATLQKEQSLVSGTAGCSTLRYVGAMGYGCPDGGTTYNYSGASLYSINGHAVTSVKGTCVNSKAKAGFSQQVIHGAWLLKFGQQRSKGNVSWAVIKGSWDNSDDPPTCYGGPMTKGSFKRCQSDSSTVTYDGYTTIDGGSVFMGSGGSAALYWYTPHLHGNQSFVSIFEGWFGSTQGLADVAHPDGALVRMTTSSTVYLVKSGQLSAFPSLATFRSNGYTGSQVKIATDPDIALTTGSDVDYREGTLLKGSDPAIYIVDNQSGTIVKRPFASWSVFAGLGYSLSNVLNVSDAALPASTGATVSSKTAAHPDGTIIKVSGQPTVYLIKDGALMAFTAPSILFSNNYTWSDEKTANAGDIALPAGANVDFQEGTLLRAPDGTVYVVDINGASVQKRPIANLSTFYGLGYSFSQAYSVSNSLLPATTGTTVGP